MPSPYPCTRVAFANFALNPSNELAYYPNKDKPTIFAEFQVRITGLPGVVVQRDPQRP
jgi:hypothetical protein